MAVPERCGWTLIAHVGGFRGRSPAAARKEFGSLTDTSPTEAAQIFAVDPVEGS